MHGKHVWYTGSPVKSIQLPRLTRSNRCLQSIKHIQAANSAAVRHCCPRQTDHATSAGQPPNQPPTNHRRVRSPDDDDSSNGYGFGRLWKAIALRIGLFTVVSATFGAWHWSFPSSATASMSQPFHPNAQQVAIEVVPMDQQDDMQGTTRHSLLTPPTGGTVQAIKRLLREVFADLTNIKQRIEDLTPRSDEEDVVIPFEGAGIEPTLQPLAKGMRRRAKAQLSGSLIWTSQAFSSKGSDLPLSAGCCGPQLEVLLQSMTPDRRHSLTARIVSEANGSGDNSTNLGTSSLQLRSLLYRAQFLGGKLRLCVAPFGGSLSNIARRLNPLAASSGLTSVAAIGHDIPMVLEQGNQGIAATWIGGARLTTGKEKPVVQRDQAVVPSAVQPSATVLESREEDEEDEPAFSLSLGHFSGRSNSANRGHQTVGQLSLHSKQSGCLSLVTSLCTQGFLQNTLSNSVSTMPSGAVAGAQDQEVHTGNAIVRIGMCGSKIIEDAFRVSAWHMRSMSNMEGIDGGVRSGLQIYSLPEEGVSYGLTLSSTQRFASRKDYMAEMSAHLPIDNGIWLTPGLVLNRSSNGVLGIHLACNTGWRF